MKKFTRLLVVLLGGFIVSIIATAYFLPEKNYVITSQMICLIVILVVLTLAEAFDKFNIGNLISLQKENKRTETELERVTQENRELRVNLTQIVSQNISNRNMNIFGGTPEMLQQLMRVEKAPAEEVKKKKEEVVERVSEARAAQTLDTNGRDMESRRRILEKIQEFSLKKYCESETIDFQNVHKDMRFSEGFIEADPIMFRNVIFDAYYRSPQDEEIFMEVRMYYTVLPILENLYHRLSKIYHYRNAKKMQAKLVLILPRLSQAKHKELELGHVYLSPQRLYDAFAPAIQNKLLEIREIVIDDADVDALIKASGR